ncbi:MAG: hypothetical protein WBM00_06925 [Solirubrobacterales bacterium]
MGMFEMSPEQVTEWRQKYRDLVEPHVNGEDVLSAAAFRRGGATASMAASKAQMGGIVYAAVKLFNKKQAGGLPERVMLAVTPQKLYAFKLGFKGRNFTIKQEAAIWERAGLKTETDRRSGMTALTIESPAEGEKATLVGIGVKDDPISQELIGVLQGAAPAEV